MVLLDILILALVVAIVVMRLTKFKLPSDTRDAATRKAELEKLFGRRRPTQQTYQVSAGPEADDDVAEPDAEPQSKNRAAPRRATPQARDVAHLPGLEQLKAMDPNFDLAGFMEGAVAAYGYFYECYNGRDREGIINLCGPALEEQVLSEWEANPAHIGVEGEVEPVFNDARLHGRTALIELTMRASHRVGKAGPKANRSVWLFARALNSTDPNWEVQSITPVADA